MPSGLNIYNIQQKILDCGNIPVTTFDNNLALKLMEQGYYSLLDGEVQARMTKQTTSTWTLYIGSVKLHPKSSPRKANPPSYCLCFVFFTTCTGLFQ